jgi:hypothetical protein
MENSKVAFRKSILSSDAIKNPLIYLNYSIFCLECLKNVEEAQQYLNNFYNLCETLHVPNEVSVQLVTEDRTAFKLFFLSFSLSFCIIETLAVYANSRKCSFETSIVHVAT